MSLSASTRSSAAAAAAGVARASKRKLAVVVDEAPEMSKKDKELLAAFVLHRDEFEAWLAEKRARDLAQELHKAQYLAKEARKRADASAFSKNPEWPVERVAGALSSARDDKNRVELNLLLAAPGGRDHLLEHHADAFDAALGDKCERCIGRRDDYPGSPCGCVYEGRSRRGYANYDPTSPSYEPTSPQ
jgi:hypothetical protein